MFPLNCTHPHTVFFIQCIHNTVRFLYITGKGYCCHTQLIRSVECNFISKVKLQFFVRIIFKFQGIKLLIIDRPLLLLSIEHVKPLCMRHTNVAIIFISTTPSCLIYFYAFAIFFLFANDYLRCV